MKEITILPAGYAEGTADEPYTARSHKKPLPNNPELYAKKDPDIRIYKVDIYYLTYTVLDPRRMNTMDRVTSKQFIKMLEVV